MTGIRFNIRQRRHKKNQKEKAGAPDTSRPFLSERENGGVVTPSTSLVACIPCPALVVGGDRKISALNDPLCEAFGIRSGFFHIGEDFADFARRMSLSGSPGLLALGDFLTDDKPPRDTEIVARNGIIYEARACQTADDKTLITLSEPSPGDTGDLIAHSHNMVKNMPGAVLSVSKRPDGFIQCLSANTMSLELLGLGLNEITETDFDFRKVITEKFLPEFERSLGRCSTISETIDMEFQVENSASGRRWVRGLASGSHGADGSGLIYLRLHDIENQRRVADERRQLQALLDMVVDNIPFMVNVKDAYDRTFILVNRAFEEMTGRSRNDILGQKDLRAFPKWDWESREACYDRLLESGKPVEIPESIAKTPNKGERLLKSNKYPLVDQAGKINYVLSISEDITERRNTENALRHSEQRFRDAIESLTDGVALFDDARRLIMCNTRYRRMWPGREKIAIPGVTVDTLIRNYLEMAASHGQKLDIEAETANAIEQHTLFRTSRDIPIFDGRWFHISNHPTSDGGFVITSTDITALKEREESLRKASRQAVLAKEAAESANRSKSDFLANMSHELRTPLNAVIGFSEIIKGALLGDHSIEPYRGYAQDIHDSGHHLLALINDVLDMAKIEAGKLELFEEPIELGTAIDASLRLVAERAHKNSISLSTDIPPDLPGLNADLRKFKQITINLLSNAVKFTPKGGSVTTRIYIGDKGDLHLQITDTGIGIAQEDLEKVLEPFGQAEGGLDRQFEGTGLGLTLTQSLAKLHGGRVEIESKTEGPVTGTTVTVIFPASRVVI